MEMSPQTMPLSTPSVEAQRAGAPMPNSSDGGWQLGWWGEEGSRKVPLTWERARGVGWGAPWQQPQRGSLGSTLTSATPVVCNTRP